VMSEQLSEFYSPPALEGKHGETFQRGAFAHGLFQLAT
jgi:hypothetical protein